MIKVAYLDLLAKISAYEYIVVDKRLLNFYPKIHEIVEKKKSFVLDEPEACKNFVKYSEALNFFLDKGITRKSRILAIGGGATSDFAGFVAATVLRGVSWDIIPTTLLSMIDACIGGKVGINTIQGKNLVGAFHLPERIIYCFDFLKTLDELELSSGKGELLKYAFLENEIYHYILDFGLDEELILKCAKFKQQIIEKDFQEAGQRKILNLGHTFGHAIEKLMSIPHGIAVYYGLEMIIRLFNLELYKDLSYAKEKISLEISPLQKMDFDHFWQYLSYDKKRINKGIEFIIIDEKRNVSVVLKELAEVKANIHDSKFYSTYFN
ncbi:MAG: 3-dehydroquinate synthase family protein [Bacteriovoracaceae bacterium]|jgi:3-dehydroquinate synthetase|nr:3-dehydroquinate synthase family protein [Bacteriovoracaceae bacterium]